MQNYKICIIIIYLYYQLPTEIVPGESNMINAVAVPGPRVSNTFLKKIINNISM